MKHAVPQIVQGSLAQMAFLSGTTKPQIMSMALSYGYRVFVIRFDEETYSVCSASCFITKYGRGKYLGLLHILDGLLYNYAKFKLILLLLARQ
ncbi:hypothetical protein EAY27_02970 [Vibrio anguillarum]|nr:hypothetical protein [Vibrio anguillarum]MBF4362985.1 hypothetical protein [Vibrio anguillarum]